VWLRSQLEFVGRKKEGGREEPKVNSCLTFVIFVLQSIGLCVYLCVSVEVLSRNFVSGWTAVVLGISRNSLGLISGNQWDNHVGLCIIFPMGTYALDLELYFKRYRCLNPGMSLSKREKKQITGFILWTVLG
jgi:hypothetical protein